MIVDLVQCMTRDGVRLDGALRVPATDAQRQLALDAMLFVHGTGGSFYSSTLFDEFAQRLLDLGCAVLRVNTRGHDGISTAVTDRGGRRLGAAYEVVDDCRHDLAAWIDWLTSRGYSRLGLLCHSLGAVKCIYALAQESHPAVACLVALSPPRLSFPHFSSSRQGPEFLETYAAAEQHVRSGQPATLMDVKIPLPYVVTAEGYIEKYGPDERYNFLKYLPRVERPSLVLFGSVELQNNMAFQGLPDAVAVCATTARASLQVEVVAGADHFYTGVRAAALARVEAWLRATLL